MLSLQELKNILKENNVNNEDFSPQCISEIYGKNIDTPLYDILAYANDFEEKLQLDEDTTFVCDILNIVITNMPICQENANRLIDLMEDADILDAYNLLMQDYKQFLTNKQIADLQELANKTFDSGVLL